MISLTRAFFLGAVLVAAGCAAGKGGEPTDTVGEARQASSAYCSAGVCYTAPVGVNIQRTGAAGTSVFDTLLVEGCPDQDNGTTNMTMGTGPFSGTVSAQCPYTLGNLRYTLLQFDLGAIPSGAALGALNASAVNIAGASMLLTEGIGAPSGAGTINVHRVTSAWTEAAASWNNAPTWDPAITTSFSNGFGLGSTSHGIYTYAVPGVDVSTLVQAWVAGTAANDGLLLEEPDGFHTNFLTSEWTTAAQRPQLDVTYTLTCSAGHADCNDSAADGCETNIASDAANCGACGQACAAPATCNAGQCTAAPSCTDGVKNGNETDVDCGGGTCPACGTNSVCKTSSDCASGTCTNGVCSTTVCSPTLPFTVPDCTNVALSKPASAGSSYPGYPVAYANDGNCSTAWNAGGYAGYWQVDLGAVQPIRGVTAAVAGTPATTVNVTVSISTDGTTFSNVVTKTIPDPAVITSTPIDFGSDLSARYVRFTESSPASWVDLYEVAVWSCP